MPQLGYNLGTNTSVCELLKCVACFDLDRSQKVRDLQASKSNLVLQHCRRLVLLSHTYKVYFESGDNAIVSLLCLSEELLLVTKDPVANFIHTAWC